MVYSLTFSYVVNFSSLFLEYVGEGEGASTGTDWSALNIPRSASTDSTVGLEWCEGSLQAGADQTSELRPA